MTQTTPEHIETEIADAAVMNITPMVSVMMMTYNHENFIAQAIEGVVSQKTDFPTELIIGEDCSTDNTRSIVLDYQKRYPGTIRVVYSDRNIGAFYNSNRLFAKVRGEFVAYCEGDDYWHDPLKLQKQVDFLRANPDYGMVFSDYDRLVYTFGAWRRIKRWNHRKYGVIPQGEIYSELLKNMFIRTCTMIGRTGLLKQHYESKLRSPKNPVGDRPIVLHMSKLAKIGYINQSLATYRRAPGSHVNSGYASLLLKRKEKIEMDFYLASELGMNEQVLLEVQRENYRLLLFFSAATRNREVFNEALQWLNLNYPALAKSKTILLWSYLMKMPLLHQIFFRLRAVMIEVLLLLKHVRPGVKVNQSFVLVPKDEKR